MRDNNFRGAWHAPHLDSRTGAPSGDSTSGAFYAATGLALRKLLLGHPWPDATIFEISTARDPNTRARCYREQLVNWQPRIARLPTSLDIPLPVSRSHTITAFSQLFWEALSYAVDTGLLEHEQCVQLFDRMISRLSRP